MMKPSEREKWIEQYLRDGGRNSAVDVLNRDFVDAYVEATRAKVLYQPYGANTCPQLGRDLLAMKKAGLLKRHRCGIQGMAGMGFPRWVWSYSLKDTLWA